MKKDQTVVDLIQWLKEKIDFELTDHWDGDPMAIGLNKGEKLVYASTSPRLKNNSVFCYYELR